MIQARCPGCGKTLNAPDKVAGKSVRCPGCGAAVAIPHPTEPGTSWKIGAVPGKAPPSTMRPERKDAPRKKPAAIARPGAVARPAAIARPGAAAASPARTPAPEARTGTSARPRGAAEATPPPRTRTALRREEAARAGALGAAGMVALLGAAVLLAGFCTPWTRADAPGLEAEAGRPGFRFPELAGELAAEGGAKPSLYVLYFLYLLPALALLAAGAHLTKAPTARSLGAGAGFGALLAILLSAAALRRALAGTVDLSGLAGGLSIGFHLSAAGSLLLAATCFLPGREGAKRAGRGRTRARAEGSEPTTAARRRRR